MHELDKEIPTSPVEGVIYVLKRNGKNGSEYLLTKRIKENSNFQGEYLFPGGKMEDFDEDFYATGRREAKEERGVDIETAKYIGKVSYPHPNGTIITQNILVVEDGAYVGEVGNTEPEKEELLWVDLEEAERLCTSEAGKTVLGKIKEFEEFG